MRTARSLLRAMAILGYAALHLARFSVVWLAMAVALRPRSRRREWFGACVLALFRDLGATFVKVGQIMSTRPDLLPPHVIRALERLQDDVGPFPLGQVHET